MQKKPLRLFTMVWGDRHFEWFKKGCLQSLAWPKNRAALKDATWMFLTRESERARIVDAVQKSGIPIGHLEFMILGPDFDQNAYAAGAYQNHAFVNEISACLTYGAQSLTAPPDTIFGDGSIKAMREIATHRDSVVFAAHIRVLPSILDFVYKDHLTNAKLVHLSMKHAHRAWTEAMDGAEMINSYQGGISWKPLGAGMYAVTHRLPTPYLINFTPEDMVFFKNQLTFGVIDHSWPAHCLIDTERQRVIGSSDAAFMVELTPEESNVPGLAPYRADEPELFWRNLSHNKINRMFQCIFRGEA
jgi:hypothetical protein